MESSVCVEQKGVIEEIIDHTARVRIHRDAMCGECSAKGICNISDTAERIIEIHDITPELHTGDHVVVRITRSMGNKAIVLGYMIPFMVLIFSLALFNNLDFKEWETGSLSILITGIYYMVLYFFRNKLRRTFSLRISKSD